MFRFKSLLVEVGLEPKAVRLVRHKHGREYQRQVYQDAIRRNARFEQYQAGQCNPRVIQLIKSAEVIASFVVDPSGESVFAGLWRVRGCCQRFVPDPYRVVPNQPKGGDVTFHLERMAELDNCVGRVVVDWGGGERAWVQYADRRDKSVLEVRRRAEEEPFPGFARFGCGLHEIDALPRGWLEPLRASGGVYLLVHRTTGAQYVGSATGAEGFLGRWRGYADGHGGNVGLKELADAADAFDVRILETSGSAATTEEVYALEVLWKAKLGSRAKGLNRN